MTNDAIALLPVESSTGTGRVNSDLTKAALNGAKAAWVDLLTSECPFGVKPSDVYLFF